MMKQVVVTGPLEYEISEVPIPVPKDNQVLVKMQAAGVCGSDMHLFLGENPKAVFPRIPGHENVGIVTEVGDDVKEIKVGDHVVIDLVVACGKCKQCRSGRYNVCQVVKARGASTDGGWREYLTVPEHEAHVISKEIPFQDAAMVEPFAIGMHCTKRAQVKPEDVVLILGSGSIGAIILQRCKQIGCKVICADINDRSLERAKSYGADEVINTVKFDLVDSVKSITENLGVDVVFDSACFHGSLELLLQDGILTNGGRIIPLGFVSDFENISQAMINGRELTIVGSRMSTGEFKPTIKKFENHEFELEGMVSHYIPFSKIEEVFENIKQHPKDLRKMIILFE